MPVLGTGIMPTGQVAAELTSVTRRAYIEKLIVQIYQSSPLMAALIANANTATGGFSSVTVPVQGASMVTAQWSGYDGNFAQPASQPGVQNAEFNMKLMTVPVQLLGMESIVQMDHSILPLIEARMNDTTNTAMDLMSTAIYGNTTNAQAFIGLPGAVDDGTNLVTYGNINRNTYPFWKSKVYAPGGTPSPTRALVLQYVAGTFKNGSEVPTFGIVGPGTWTLLAQDFVSSERYEINPGSSFDQGAAKEDGPRSAFRALMVAGMPVFMDQYCPEGTMYLLNSNYLSLYIHEQGSFNFTGFYSAVPNFQLGYVGVVVAIAELVNTKPKTCTRVSGLGFLTL